MEQLEKNHEMNLKCLWVTRNLYLQLFLGQLNLNEQFRFYDVMHSNFNWMPFNRIDWNITLVKPVSVFIWHNVTWCQLHQCSTISFSACRSQKRKKDWQLYCFFALLGSGCVKPAHRTLMKLTQDVFDGNSILLEN